MTILFWSLAGAILVTLLVTTATVRLLNFFRSKRYDAQRKARRRMLLDIQSTFNLPNYDVPVSAQGLLDLVLNIHSNSVSSQDAYQREIMRTAGCLGLAFTALALNTTVVHGPTWVKLSLAWLDFVALVAIIYCFFRGRRAIAKWLISRSLTELLRQYAFLSLLFPSAQPARVNGGLTGAFESEANEILNKINCLSAQNLASQIAQLWQDRRDKIERLSLSDKDLSRDAILFHLDRRPLRQLAWFRASRERLEQSERRRSRLLEIMYAMAIALAALKVAVLFLQNLTTFAEVVSFFLLVTTGVAMVITAMYFSQNSRSLIHRYNTQERQIGSWLNTFMHRFEKTRSGQSANELILAKQEMRNHILSFEDLMIDELVDWIHISEHDAIDLTP